MVWSEIWDPLSKNLIWVCAMFGLFALCVTANIVAGIYYHVRHIGQCWNKTQFFNSILRMLAIGISTAILAVVSTVAPLILSGLGLINEEFSKMVSITLIVGMYGNAIIKYFKEALATLGNILENQDVVEELQPERSQPEEPEVREDGDGPQSPG